MPHLASMAEEYGKKGFNILAITNESRETVLKFMEQLAPAPVNYTIGVGGGSNEYPASGIPKAFLVSAEGKIVWEGSPGGFSTKLLEEELKKVKVTDEMRAAKGEKTLAYAEGLIAKKEVLRAVNLLEKLAKDAKAGEPAKKAAERVAAVNADAAAKQLDALAKKSKETAPATAALAEGWAKVLREDWKAEK
jgi:hypothetical protein